MVKFVINKSDPKGYVFIDVLIAIFIFALGFAGLYSLTEEAVRNTQSSMNLAQAVSLAQSKLETAGNAFIHQRLFEGYISPGEGVHGTEDKLSWNLDSEWTEVPNLLKIKVQIRWQENRKNMVYDIESLFYIPSSDP